MIDVTTISTGEFMTRLYLVFNTHTSTVKAIQKELTSYEGGGKTIVEVFTDINGTLSNLPQDKADLSSEMLFDTMQASIPPELRNTIRKLLRTDRSGKREYSEQVDYIDYLRTHGLEIDEIRKRQGGKGHLGSKKTVNQVQNRDYDPMDMWKKSVNNIKLGEQGESQEQTSTTPPPTAQNNSQDSSQRTLRYCTFCQMDGHFADRCFKNPKGNRYNENYSKFNKPQN